MDIRKDYMEVLNSIDGLLVIDAHEKIVFMCPELLKASGYVALEEVLGKNIRDVLYHSEIYKTVKTKMRETGVMYLAEGHVVASNDVPIFQNGKLLGALEYDLFQNPQEMLAFINKVQTAKGVEHFKKMAQNPQKTKYAMDDIKGSSRMIFNLKEEIKLAARSNSTVLISGETGTGKELVAQSIHSASQRSLFEFVEINCAAVPGELFESELFGYEEGSFTGAKKGGKKGLAEVAHKGTLFLDEIDSLPLHMQAKLLRFLQEKEVLKIGGGKPTPVDVRIIAATNKDLRELVEKDEFREDLYYRLHVMDIAVGPLRQRKSDIPELVNNFMLELNESLGRSVDKHMVKRVDDEALKILMSYEWPGNIRELHNVIERAMNHCYEETLRLEHFQGILLPKGGAVTSDMFSVTDTLAEMKEKVEVFAITRLLEQENMTLTKAADILGISRQMLHKKMKKYELR